MLDTYIPGQRYGDVELEGKCSTGKANDMDTEKGDTLEQR